MAKKKYNSTALAVKRLHSTVESATRRNKEFSLTLLYLNNIMKHTHCAYSGVKFSDDKTSGDYMTLERLDNSKGYIDGNVIPVAHRFNSLRGSKTIEQLIAQRNQAELNMNEAAKLVDEDFIDDRAIIQRALITPNSKFDTVRKWTSDIANNVNKIKEHEKNIAKWTKHQDEANVQKYSTSIGIAKSAIEAMRKKIENANFHMKNYCRKYIELIENNQSKFERYRNEMNNLDVLIAAIKKFDNLSSREKSCVSVGIPITSSRIELLKAKIVYNLY